MRRQPRTTSWRPKADTLFPFIMLPPLVGETSFALWLLAARHE
jgi:hypothetical protein